MSLLPHGTTRLPQEGCSLNLILGILPKIFCRKPNTINFLQEKLEHSFDYKNILQIYPQNGKQLTLWRWNYFF